MNSVIFDLISNLKNTNYKEFEELENNTDSEMDKTSKGTSSEQTSSLLLDKKSQKVKESKTEQEEGKMLEEIINIKMSQSTKLKEFQYPNMNSKKNLSYFYLELDYRSKIFFYPQVKNLKDQINSDFGNS